MGAGRPLGSPNKKNAARMFADMGLDPLYEMAKLANKEQEPNARFAKMAELAPYAYAKLKQIDHKFDPQLAEQAEEFGTLDKDEQIRLLRLKADELERGQ